MPHYSSLLLVVNVCRVYRLASGVSAFDRRGLRLPVLRVDTTSRLMVRSARLFRFSDRRIRIDPLHGNGVKRCSRDRAFLAVIFTGVAEIVSGPVSPYFRPCYLYSAISS